MGGGHRLRKSRVLLVLRTLVSAWSATAREGPRALTNCPCSASPNPAMRQMSCREFH